MANPEISESIVRGFGVETIKTAHGPRQYVVARSLVARLMWSAFAAYRLRAANCLAATVTATAIAEFAKQGGFCDYTNKTIAEKTGTPIRTVGDHIEALSDCHLICSLQQGPRAAWRYMAVAGPFSESDNVNVRLAVQKMSDRQSDSQSPKAQRIAVARQAKGRQANCKATTGERNAIDDRKGLQSVSEKLGNSEENSEENSIGSQALLRDISGESLRDAGAGGARQAPPPAPSCGESLHQEVGHLSRVKREPSSSRRLSDPDWDEDINSPAAKADAPTATTAGERSQP